MRGYAALGLVGPKNPINVGHVLRAARCYDAGLVVVEPRNGKMRSATDTHKAWRHIPTLRVDDLMEHIPFDCRPVAVEFTDDAQDLRTFEHPQRAFYIFGPEDGSIPKRVLERCWATVKVPTALCMNLAATANVVLYDRLLKQGAS